MEDKIRLAELKNEQGNISFNLKKYTNALYFYEFAIKTCPNVAKYYANRSACYLMIGEFIKAQSDAQKAIDLDSNYIKGYIRVVKCCLITGNLKYAASVLQNARKIFPQEQEILDLTALVTSMQENLQKCEKCLENKKYDEALQIIEQSLKKKPDCITFLIIKGKCLINLQEFNKAEKIADDIIKIKKTEEDAIYIKISAQCYQEDVKSALPLVTKLKKKLPDHQQVTQLFTNTKLICKNINKIEQYIQNYDYQHASTLIKDTIKIDPNYVVTNKRLFLRKIDIAEIDEKLHWNGVLDCEEFMSIYGKNLHLLKIKVKLLMNLKEYEDAIEDYEEILKMEKSEENETNLRKTRELFNEQLVDDFKILNISRQPSIRDVKKAALELKFRYHPDKNVKATPEVKKKLERKFIRVKNAEDRLLKKL